MENKFIFAFIFVVFIAGCATERPIVRMEKGFSLTGYKIYEVAPVLNETGKSFDFDVADTITQHIKTKLKDKGFIVIEETSPAENIVVIKSILTSYEPGSAFQRWLLLGAGKSQCIVKSKLIHKKTGNLMGEIISSKAISGGGLFSIGADKAILKMVAADIVDEIERKVKGEQ